MNRPMGVTVLAVLDFIGAGTLVLSGILFLLGFGLLGGAMTMGGAMARPGASSLALAGLGAAGSVFLFVFAAIAAVLGYGLWNLRNWARVITIVLAALGIVLAIPSLLFIMFRMAPLVLIFLVVRVAINGVIIWYLLQPDVRQAFSASW